MDENYLKSIGFYYKNGVLELDLSFVGYVKRFYVLAGEMHFEFGYKYPQNTKTNSITIVFNSQKQLTDFIFFIR